ncbi:hypothetical protein MPH_02180 [Macrophomina phaseolina MS6]|uniref:Oxidoreductase molybdopterin binding protein n=1 Tax=Macrophomina phaseolina (strain MS6) TaxID=1126212 RepID=K2S629_MACPH|nr:hypothetical protein MPH_02180 [Macrophomina phaseolina MS6]
MEPGAERKPCISMKHGFHFRPPPPPHLLRPYITHDDQLFETVHVGLPNIDTTRYIVLVDGLVQTPFTLSLPELYELPSVTVTSFHECFGSPLRLPVKNPWRVGNVEWTGVRLSTILAMARPLESASFVWTEGLDHGTFAGTYTDRYQKDLPMAKAMSPEVILAYKINGEPLRNERGGPVRLVVPGWFGTNATKWLCRITLQDRRAPSLFTTKFYNVRDPATGASKPVWSVEPNSLINSPGADAVLDGPAVSVEGWAWSHDGIAKVEVTSDGGSSWVEAQLEERKHFSWQRYRVTLELGPGRHRLAARAMSVSGEQQPMSGNRNHVHTITVEVLG